MIEVLIGNLSLYIISSFDYINARSIYKSKLNFINLSFLKGRGFMYERFHLICLR